MIKFGKFNIVFGLFVGLMLNDYSLEDEENFMLYYVVVL